MLDKEAEKGNDTAFKLPTPSVDGAPLDFSFSGLKTAVINIISNNKQKGIEINKADLSASYRKAVVDYLVKNLMLAAEKTGQKKIVIAGGVSANSLLRKRLEEECKKRKLQFFRPELKYCGDNAAMVASQGYYEFLAGNRASLDLNACAQRSIDIG